MEQVRAGASIDEEGNAINQVEKVLLANGIKLREDNNTFRDMSDVLQDVAVRYKELAASGNTVAQQQVIGAIAGVRQANMVAALMENWEQVTKAQEIATGSAGLASERYKVYMDSIEAAMNEFKASWQEMWTKTIMSGDLKGIVNFGTVVLDLINKMGGLVPILEVIVGLLITFKAEMISTSIIAGITKMITGFKSLGAAIKAAFTLTGLTSWVGILVTLAGVIYSVISLIPTLTERIEKSVEKINSLSEELKGLRDSKDSFESLWREMDTLNKKTALTTEEQKRLRDIQNEIKGIIPEIIGSYDAEGNFIIANNASRLIYVRLLQDEIEAKQELIRLESEATVTSAIKQYQKEAQELNNLIDSQKRFADLQSSYEKNPTEGGPLLSNISDKDIAEQKVAMEESAKSLMELYSKVGDESKAVIEAALKSAGLWNEELSTLPGNIDATGNAAATAAQSIDELTKASDDAQASVISLADEVVGLMVAYEKSGEVSMQQVEQLKAMFPDKYTEALSIENGQIKLNTDVLKQLTIARMEEAIAKAQQVSTTLNATIQEAQANISSANTVISTTNAKIQALGFLEGAYGRAAIAAINSANNQVAASKAILTNTQAQLKSNDAGIKVMQTYLGQMKDGTYWTNAMASATSGAAGATNKLSDAQQAYNDLLDITIKMIRQQKEDEKDALKDQLDGYKKIIDARKKALQLAHDEADYQDELASKNKTLGDIENELLQLQFDNSEEGKRRRLELEADRAKAVEDIDKTQADHSLETQTNALDEEYNQYKEMIDAKTKAIDEYLAHAGQVTQDAMALLSAGSEGFYQSLLNWNRQYGDGIDSTIAKLWEMMAAQNAVASSYGGGGYVPQPIQQPLPSNYGGVDAPASKYDKMDALSSGISSTTATTSKVDRYDLMNAVPIHHSGGVVGGLPKIKESEQYAKLLKGEVVASDDQMKTFINTTLPNLVANFAGSGGIPNVEMNFNVEGNLDKTVLPELKEVILTTVYKAMKLRGNQKNANSYSL